MRFLALLLAALVCAPATRAAHPTARTAPRPAAHPPNVVLVMMDDLGYGDLGSYGAPDARTPNLDRLAREGVRLTDAYAAAPVCTPTRAALITGRYPQRVGLGWSLIAKPEDMDKGLPVTGTSLPALLAKNGYRTALIGKWHLGFTTEFGPNAHGFDEFFGFLIGTLDYYTHRGTDGAPALYENTTPVEVPGYLTDEITRRAVSFIERNARRPFFLDVAYNAVHWPFQPPGRPVPQAQPPAPPELHDKPDDAVPATRDDYLRMLERADQGVGDILAAIERHDLAQRTLIIFTSDNGGEWLSRNAPHFHRKGTLWEGGIRVPLILRWPGKLPAGRSSAQVAVTMDLTASILAATRTPVPTDYRPDGMDLLPGLQGRAAAVERQLYWRVRKPGNRQEAVRAGRWKLLVDGGQLLLFDLGNDPGERTELAARHPQRVRALRQLLADWERDVDRDGHAQR